MRLLHLTEVPLPLCGPAMLHREEVSSPASSQQTVRLLHLAEVALPLCDPGMLLGEEVSSPKTINIRQYLSTRHFLVDNRYFIIKSSQTTQLYITKVFDTQFSCHDYIRKNIYRNKS